MAQLPLATTLPEVVAAFAPEKPLQGEQIAAYYVERAHAPWQQMKKLLQDSAAQAVPARLLLTGNVGSGKSTELNKLLRELDNRFLVVKVCLKRILPPIVLTQVDLVFMAAAALAQTVGNDVTRPMLQVLAQDVTAYFEGGMFSGRIRLLRGNEPAEPVPVKTVGFDAFYQKEPVSRAPVYGRVDTRLPAVIDGVNVVIDGLQTAGGCPLLFVFDDTDKIAPEWAERIFYNHPASLAEIHASAAYTMPSSLWYLHSAHAAGASFAGSFRLPDINLYTGSGECDVQGRKVMDDMISRRMVPSLIAPGVREQMLEDSGGRVHRLIGIVHFAAVNAVGRKASKIEQYDADRAATWLTSV